MFTVALAGNPNCGKTTLFNNLTGSNAHVGNWPGVTVERREGVYRKKKDFPEPINIVDLPGIYSLSPNTSEEVVSRNFILNEKPDVVINLVDATNLSRNLLLTLQLLEMDVPVIVALNLMDVIDKHGDKVDVDTLSEKLGVPVVPISALKGRGMRELMEKVYALKGTERQGKPMISDETLLATHHKIEEEVRAEEIESPVFIASKLLESDPIVSNQYQQLAEKCREIIEADGLNNSDTDAEERVTDNRYDLIDREYYPCYTKGTLSPAITFSDRVDKVLTNRWLGLPIFAVVMFLIFCIVFNDDFLFMGAMGLRPLRAFYEDVESAGMPSLGIFLQDTLDYLLNELLLGAISDGLAAAGCVDWAISLICDGILASVFAVITFLPVIILLELFIQILENSGYMARVAFCFDRALRKFGISGRCIIPLISSFGCGVPGIMGTRTVESEREKVVTISLVPFFACGAKLPIFLGIGTNIIQVLTGGALQGGIVAFILYAIGIIGAIIAGYFSNEYIIQGKSSPFIMEFPPYMVPQFKATMIALWDETKRFIKRAGTVIALMSAVLWFLQSFGWDWHMVDDISDSILASIGSFIQPFFYPLGFAKGDDGWKYVVSAITGLVAKEQVVGTMELLGIYDVASSAVTVPAAFSFLVYNLFTLPCVAAISAARAELKSKKNFRYVMCFWLLTSYVMSIFTYGIGSFSLIGTESYGALEITMEIIALVLLAALIVLVVLNRRSIKKNGRAIRIVKFNVEDKNEDYINSVSAVNETSSSKKKKHHAGCDCCN